VDQNTTTEINNVVSINTARTLPLARFEERIAEVKDTFLLSPLCEVIQLFLLKTKKDFTPDGMATVDGTIDVHGNSACVTLYCAEGALFPEPVTSAAFMTIEQIIELPYDYVTIEDPEELKALGPRYSDWVQSFGKMEEVGHVFGVFGAYVWNVLVSLGYETVDYGLRQAEGGDYQVFTFVCQKLDLKFVVEVDCFRLVTAIQQLRVEAAKQNYKFL